MSHYDCRRCGTYGCFDLDCSTPETIAKEKELEKQRQISNADKLLRDELTIKNKIAEAKRILEDAGLYNVEVHFKL